MNYPTYEWGDNNEFHQAVNRAIEVGYLPALDQKLNMGGNELPWTVQTEFERRDQEAELYSKTNDDLLARICELEAQVIEINKKLQDPHEYMKVRVSNFELQF
jgi:hypothetical protein